MAKRTITYEVDICEQCGYERMSEVRSCVVCGKAQCAGCTPTGYAGLEPPMTHDARLTFPRCRFVVCFDCAPEVGDRIAALFAKEMEVKA